MTTRAPRYGWRAYIVMRDDSTLIAPHAATYAFQGRAPLSWQPGRVHESTTRVARCAHYRAHDCPAQDCLCGYTTVRTLSKLIEYVRTFFLPHTSIAPEWVIVRCRLITPTYLTVLPDWARRYPKYCVTDGYEYRSRALELCGPMYTSPAANRFADALADRFRCRVQPTGCRTFTGWLDALEKRAR